MGTLKLKLANAKRLKTDFSWLHKRNWYFSGVLQLCGTLFIVPTDYKARGDNFIAACFEHYFKEEDDDFDKAIFKNPVADEYTIVAVSRDGRPVDFEDFARDNLMFFKASKYQ